MLKAVPAVVVAGAKTAKCVAAAALTWMALLVPVTLPERVSVAVSVWKPAVLSVALNEPVPLLRVLLAGKIGRASCRARVCVAVSAVAVLLNDSCAVVFTLEAVPAVVVAGAKTAKCVAAAALTWMALLVPVTLPERVSVAVSVWKPAVLSVALNEPVPLLRVLLAG